MRRCLRTVSRGSSVPGNRRKEDDIVRAWKKYLRGDADYLDVGVSMLLSVVLGTLVMFAFIALINHSVIKGMEGSFGTEHGIARPAQFHIRNDTPPVITLPDRSQDAEIKAFYFERIPQETEISPENHTVAVIVPESADVRNLVPIFAVSDKASVSFDSGEAESGITPMDFTESRTLTVTAESGRTVQWKITVTKGSVSGA